jgi:hypothetical protein
MSGRATQLQTMMQFFRVAADNDNGISPAARPANPRQPPGVAKTKPKVKAARATNGGTDLDAAFESF